MGTSTGETLTFGHLVFLEQPTEEDIEGNYGDLSIGSSICVMNDPSQPRQPYKGVFASKNIDMGAEIFREGPLVAMQSVSSAQTTLNCHECLGYIGDSIEDQMMHFLECRQRAKPDEDVKKVTGDAVVGCCGGCADVYYCSIACRDASWKAHHSLMCSGVLNNDGKEWCNAFYEHAYNTNDIFILAGKAMSMVVLDAYRAINELHLSPQDALVRAWKPFKMGYKKKWWDSVALPRDVDPSNEDQFRADLKELANDSFTLYSHAVELGHPHMYSVCSDVIHIDVWGSLIGMFELNNLSIVGRGPCSFFQYGEDQIKKRLKSDDFVEEFMDAILEGTGFYRLHSCMNHSCEPNCRAMLPESNSENNKAIIHAVRAIEAGEELTVSYVEEDEPYNERQEQLRDYGFECLCSKCEQEKNPS